MYDTGWFALCSTGRELSISGVLAAMTFAVRKIEGLKNLAAIAEAGNSLFPDFRLAVRIHNIRRALGLLQSCLSRIKPED